MNHLEEARYVAYDDGLQLIDQTLHDVGLEFLTASAETSSPSISEIYILPQFAGLDYAFTAINAVYVWTRGGYQVARDPSSRSRHRGSDAGANGTTRVAHQLGGLDRLCVCFLAYSLYLFVNMWLPSYLVDEFGISLRSVSCLMLDNTLLLTSKFPNWVLLECVLDADNDILTLFTTQ